MKKLLIILAFLPLLISGQTGAGKYKSGIWSYNGGVVSFNNTHDFWTVVTASSYTYSMTIKGNAGEKLYIDWGDSSGINNYTFTGANQIITHSYAAGTFQQKWAVNPLSVTLLNAGSQRLSGALPVFLQGFYNLTDFRIFSNTFNSDLSTWSTELVNWTNIVYFYINNNSFTGDLSSWSALSTWTSIDQFHIYVNSFTGDLSSWSALSTWTNIKGFILFSNNFTGDLSSWSAFSTWTSITSFQINSNSFTGDLSSWSAFSTWTGIQYFLIRNNSFTGDLSSWSALSTWTNIIQFYIYSNNFTGISAIESNTLVDYSANINNISLATFIDNLFVDFETFYTSNTPTRNLTVNVSGGTNAAPTSIGTTAISNLESLFTTAGFVFTAITN